MSPNPWAEAPAHVGTPDEREARVPRRSHGRSTAPLSAAQRVLRRLHRLDLHGGMASRPVGLRLHGPLDVMALGRAIEEVVRRHEALRTVFRDDADGPVQVVQPVGPVPLAGVDLRAHPPAEREAEAMRVAAAESRRPFDLAVGPMVRALLIRIDAQDHALVLSMHHMSADAWSAVILLHELAALYGAFASGASSPLAELPIQYADYAAWEAEQLEAGRLDEQLRYWRRHLTPLPPALALLTDRPWPMGPTCEAAEFSRVIGPADAAHLRAWSRTHRVTPCTTLLAALEALLGAYTRQQELVIGLPVAGRGRPELEELIGCFTNVLPVRADLSGRPTFLDLLERVREATLSGVANKDVPLERVVQELKPDRRPNRWPFFDVSFQHSSVPRGADTRAGDVIITPFAVGHEGMGGMAISAAAQQEPDGLRFTLRFSTELFHPGTGEAFTARYFRLLEAALEHPDRPLEALLRTTDAERRMLRGEWNRTGAEYPSDRCVHQLVQAQAERTPHRTAIRAGERIVTYRELMRLAERGARHLRKLGVGPDVVVGVCAARSPEMCAAILAILCAGGAYLPLDPAAPPERLRELLEIAGVPVLVADGLLLAELRLGDARGIALDELGGPSADEPVGSPGVAPSGENLAYVLFTSGSTGRPKGVSVSHRSLVNHLEWRRGRFGPSEADRVLHSAALGFDDAIWETFEPLISGAEMVLAPPELQHDATGLVNLIADAAVSVACFVPSLLAAVLEEPGLARCRSLRRVETGGEVLAAPTVTRFFERLPHATLFNGYGPAEATVACTYWECSPDASGANPPIGRPVANTTAYVLDERLEPVPPGIPGELYIGGDSVARGYLGRAAETAAAFVPDPLGDSAGGRLYRTGDLARYRPDGALEFLGRTDFQLKIRGARVEPGEVEAGLRQTGLVRHAAVALRRDPRGEPQLVAWVVMAGANPLSAAALRSRLRARLPAHMVPTLFLGVPALPLTSSGKLDRRALPEVPAGAWAAESADRRALTDTERGVAAIWGEVLGHPAERATHDFFELGGSPTLALRMLARVGAAFGVELPLRSIFETPVLADFARVVDTAVGAGQGAATGIGAGPVDPDTLVAPTSFAQRRLWLLDQLEPGSPWYTVATCTRLTGSLDAQALERALAMLVERHESLRTSFVPVDGIPMQSIAPRAVVPLPVTDLSQCTPAERQEAVDEMARRESLHSFDLASGPLLRARLLRLGPMEHVLFLVVHHIVSDAWSMGVLHRDLAACYRAARAGRQPELPALPVQYADYAAWQHEQMSGDVLERELSYWLRQLADAPPVIELPLDRPRPKSPSLRGGSAKRALSDCVVGALHDLSRQERATTFMTLLAGFAVLLARYSGEGDVVIGSPIAGRLRQELEDVVGFFVNTLALRVRIQPGDTFRDLLKRVRETALDAYTHQELPFDRLVEALHPGRSLQHNPVFQVLFHVQNAPHQPFALEGVEAAPLPITGSTAMFDLALSIVEADGHLTVHCSYRMDLFDQATIEHLLSQYTTLLAKCVASPDLPVASHVLGTVESSAFLPDPTRPLPEPALATVPDVIAALAKSVPGHPAVEQDGRTWELSALVAAAEELGAGLRNHGIACGDVVGVAGAPSFGLVTALLGTLRAGAVMLPVDPGLPPLRQRLMLREAGARCLIRVGHTVGGGPEEDVPTWRVAADTGALADARGTPPDRAAATPDASHQWGPRPEDPAYVFFTSGSSGRPKAVLGTHKALAHFLAWQRSTFGIGPGDRCALLSNLSFDVLLRDVFLPLTSAATLCLPPVEYPRDRLLGWIAEARATVIHVVPCVFSVWLDRDGAAPLRSLRWVFFSGEPLTDVLVRRLRDAAGTQCGVVNLYGATEATMAQACHIIGDRVPPGAQPAGRPLPDTQLLVVSPSGTPCGVNEVGEIVVRTPFLTRGYLNAPAEHASRFVANPFRDDPNDRVYRTGDLGRYAADGTLRVLGRRDDQVKVRGSRVEPGEVAAVLLEDPKVRDCCVVARRDAAGDAVLVAYVVPLGEVDTASLIAFLRSRLPDAFVPTAVVPLAALPLLPNGKLDRSALPLPAPAGLRGHARPLSGAVEVELARIWRDLLSLDGIGPEDDFFGLGGHSLAATRVMSRIRQAFGVDLPLRAIFDAPTLSALAERIEAARPAAAPRDEPPLVRIPRGLARTGGAPA